MQDPIDKIIATLQPLIDDGILKIEKIAEGKYKVNKIEGTFDYDTTKKLLFDCSSILRNEVENLDDKTSYYKWIFGMSEIKKLELALFLFDKIIQAFMQALSISKSNLNSKMLWNFEMQFFVNNHQLLINSANSLYQKINEKHVRTTIFLATFSITLAIIAIIFSLN